MKHASVLIELDREHKIIPMDDDVSSFEIILQLEQIYFAWDAKSCNEYFCFSLI